MDTPDDEHAGQCRTRQSAPKVNSQVRNGKDHYSQLKNNDLKHAG